MDMLILCDLTLQSLVLEVNKASMTEFVWGDVGSGSESASRAGEHFIPYTWDITTEKFGWMSLGAD